MKTPRRTMRLKGPAPNRLTVQLGQVCFKVPHKKSSLSNSSRFQNLLDSESQNPESKPPPSLDVNADDKNFILSQDLFCTPDYITPDSQYISNKLENKENIPSPKSPDKIKVPKSKLLHRPENILAFGSHLSEHEQDLDLLEQNEEKLEKVVTTEVQGKHSYVSQSAVALRCRVMPPPCISNPYLKDTSGSGMDPFSNQRSKCAGFFPSLTGGDGQSRYRSDFHEIEEIGNGNFSHVFKVLNRIDGSMYAVKKSTKVLHNDTERRKALMEVQALAALGFHENLVGYYSSWFENEQLFIQMELCDHSLSISKPPKLCTEGQVLDVMHQIAKALVFIHERGIAHLDLKPENIYKKNGIYKLGDFGCTTLLDKSLPIEEGDAHYMPLEILNDNYDHLEKVDIFSLGITIFELIRGATLPKSGPLLLNLRQGKLPLLPGHTVHFQSLLKAMMDPDPIRRPSARELVDNPIFDRCQRSTKAK
ncbi:wee1-like protein kinase [Impatiens glandulifera]|uniref:wee1-like protein kinase n=1 Tax=Impatiens glandulifera TaxID=253017 RepID=UPI001FB0D783|nr:wee1-like protein kinase [Impatiens glandulifera]